MKLFGEYSRNFLTLVSLVFAVGLLVGYTLGTGTPYVGNCLSAYAACVEAQGR